VEIFAAQGAPLESLTSVANGKNLQSEKLFFLRCSVVEWHIDKFFLKVHFKVSSVWYYSHHLTLVSLTPVANLPPALLTPMANLPPVSSTPAVLVAKFAADVLDTGGKFAIGVVAPEWP
jgi:hypothetical protein